MEYKPVSVDIYFKDLTKTAQQHLLETFKLKTEKEANWDVFPLATIEGEWASLGGENT